MDYVQQFSHLRPPSLSHATLSRTHCLAGTRLSLHPMQTPSKFPLRMVAMGIREPAQPCCPTCSGSSLLLLLGLSPPRSPALKVMALALAAPPPSGCDFSALSHAPGARAPCPNHLRESKQVSASASYPYLQQLKQVLLPLTVASRDDGVVVGMANYPEMGAQLHPRTLLHRR